MQKVLWCLFLALPLGWVALAVTNPDNDWSPSDERMGWVAPGGPWLHGPSAWDWAGVGLLALAGLGLALTSRRSSRLVGVVVGSLGLAAIAVGYFGGNAATEKRSELFAPLGPGGELKKKPGLSETILGYHYLTPEEGGPAAFADGSVRHVTAEEFRTARKAEPPDVQPVWKSPAKPRPAEPTPAPPGETEAQRKVRQAQERAAIGSDLKRLALAYSGSSPPLGPNDMAKHLDERQRAALTDGTYVWYFGWGTLDPQSVEAERARWPRMYRYDLLSWLGLHLCGLGVGLTLFGLVSVARGRAAGTPGA